MPDFKVISNRKLTDQTFVLRTERPLQEIQAGQCFSVGTSSLAINREYSMYSAANDDYVDFLIRKVEDGRVSTALSKLNSGDSIEIGGPYGKFCLDEDLIPSKKFVFIASGTGIAPFHSFYLTYPQLKFELLHGIRYQNEEYDAKEYPTGTYKSYISRPENITNSQRVTEGLQNRVIDENEIYYLCGNRDMIIDCISILRSKGIHGDSIFTETFF